MAFLQLSRFALLAGVFKCSISVRSVFQCIFWILTAVTSTYNQAWGLVVGSAEWCSWDCDVNLQPGLGQQSGGSFCEKVTHAAETDASGRRCPDDLTAQPASWSGILITQTLIILIQEIVDYFCFCQHEVIFLVWCLLVDQIELTTEGKRQIKSIWKHLPHT